MAENRSNDTKSAKSAKDCSSTGSNRTTDSKECHCNEGKSGSKTGKKSGKKND